MKEGACALGCTLGGGGCVCTWWHVGRCRVRVHLVARWVMEGACALGGTLGEGGSVCTWWHVG